MYQSLEGRVFYIDRNSKMTTTAGHSFYIGPIGSFYNKVNDTDSSRASGCGMLLYYPSSYSW